jgi:hypothetical protein
MQVGRVSLVVSDQFAAPEGIVRIDAEEDTEVEDKNTEIEVGNESVSEKGMEIGLFGDWAGMMTQTFDVIVPGLAVALWGPKSIVPALQ